MFSDLQDKISSSRTSKNKLDQQL